MHNSGERGRKKKREKKRRGGRRRRRRRDVGGRGARGDRAWGWGRAGKSRGRERERERERGERRETIGRGIRGAPTAEQHADLFKVRCASGEECRGVQRSAEEWRGSPYTRTRVQARRSTGEVKGEIWAALPRPKPRKVGTTAPSERALLAYSV
jgi:hypothetical protein